MAKNKITISRIVRRRKYLVDQPFQSRVAILLGFIALLNAIYMGVMFHYYAKETFKLASQYSTGFVISPEMFTEHMQSFYRIMVIIVGSEIMFILMFGVVISHRFSGPLYVINKKLKELAAGENPSPIQLRKNDLLRETADNVNAVIELLGSKKSK